MSVYAYLMATNAASIVGGIGDRRVPRPPLPITDAVQLSANGSGTFGAIRKADGSILHFGFGKWITNLPADLRGAVDMAVGSFVITTVMGDGTLLTAFDPETPPTPELLPPPQLQGIKRLRYGSSHGVALKHDGTVVAWGSQLQGIANVPSGLSNVIDVATTFRHTLGLKSDGTVVAWGNDSHGQTEVPTNLVDVIAVSAGATHSLALRSDGSVVGWGETEVPRSLHGVKQISAGAYCSAAILADGSLVTWGATAGGFKRLKGVQLIEAGGDGFLVFGPGPYASPITKPNSPDEIEGSVTVYHGSPFSLEAHWFSTTMPSIQWLQDGMPIPGATNAVLNIGAFGFQHQGIYSVTIRDSQSGAESQPVGVKASTVLDNDAFAHAFALPTMGGRTTVESTQASLEFGEPSHAGQWYGGSLWFKWVAPLDAPVDIDTDGTAIDTILAVYTGTELQDLVLVAANDDALDASLTNPRNSKVSFSAHSGTTYSIALVHNKWSSSQTIGPAVVNVNFALPVLGTQLTSQGADLLIISRGGNEVWLETSTDLTSWQRMRVIQLPRAGRSNFPIVTSASRLFYRLSQ